MGLTLATAACNAACNGVVDLVDAGPGPGKLKIQDASNAVICEVTLSDPAFGDAVGGVAVANGLPLQGASTAVAGSSPAQRDLLGASIPAVAELLESMPGMVGHARAVAFRLDPRRAQRREQTAARSRWRTADRDEWLARRGLRD